MDFRKQDYDYVGYPCVTEGGIPLAQGGAGFWMSRKAMDAALSIGASDRTIYSDRFIGLLMHEARIKLHADFRYNAGKYIGDRGIPNITPNRNNEYISGHFVDSRLMRYLDRHFKKGVPASVNSYHMIFYGRKVRIFQRGTEWFYVVDEKESSSYPMAQKAEIAACSHCLELSS